MPAIVANLVQLLISKLVTLLLESSIFVSFVLRTSTEANFSQLRASKVVKLLHKVASILVNLEQLFALRVCRSDLPVIVVKPERLAVNDCKSKVLNPSIVDKLEQLLMSKEVTLVQLVRSSFVNCALLTSIVVSFPQFFASRVSKLLH